MLIFSSLININQTSLWSSNSWSASRHKCCNESTWAANWTKRAMNACSSPWLRSTTAWDSRRFWVKSSFSLSAWKQNTSWINFQIKWNTNKHHFLLLVRECSPYIEPHESTIHSHSLFWNIYFHTISISLTVTTSGIFHLYFLAILLQTLLISTSHTRCPAHHVLLDILAFKYMAE